MQSSFTQSDKRSYLPECWQDDKRMEVLFAPFRVRDTNPEGWDTKMHFWINAINKWSSETRAIAFTIEDLRKAFQRGDKKPSVDCLKLAISQMRREQKVYFGEDLPFRNMKTVTKKALDWTINTLIFKPFSLAVNAINSDDSHPNEKIFPGLNAETVFYNKDTMDSLLESAQKWASNLKTTCTKYETFRELINNELFHDEPIKDATLDVIIEALESRNILHSKTESGIRIVKYGKNSEIQEADISLIKLDVCKEVIHKECEKLDAEIDKLKRDAHQALQDKNRDRALLILKKKKRIEAKLNEKETQIDNLELLHQQILDSHSQQEMLNALQFANGVLKKSGTRLEDVENTIAQVEEALDEVSMLNNEFNRPLTDNTGLENEAEEELNEILRDIEDEKAAEAEKLKQEKDDQFLQQLTDLTIIDSDISTISTNAQEEEEAGALVS